MGGKSKPVMGPRMFMNYLAGMIGLIMAIFMAIGPFFGSVGVTAAQAVLIAAVGLICFVLVVWIGNGTANYQLDYDYWPWHYRLLSNLLCLPVIVFGFALILVWVIFRQNTRDSY